MIVTRRGHPLARGRATFERYLACGHVVVGTSLPGLSPVQRAIAQLERSRDVQARVPSLLLALSLAAETDLVAPLPARIVRASGLPLTTRPVPFEVEPLTLHIVFHPRWTTDPRHRGIRESLTSGSTARGRARASTQASNVRADRFAGAIRPEQAIAQLWHSTASVQVRLRYCYAGAWVNVGSRCSAGFSPS